MMKLKLLRAFFLILCIGSLMIATATQIAAAPTGKITGTVTDASDGSPLMDARVTATETGGTATAGPEGFALTYTNGRYVLDIPAGTYRLTATHSGYEAGIQDMVTVEAGKTIALDFALSNEVYEIDEMEVVEKALDTSEMFQLLKRKETPVIADSIAAETIAKLPESDVAGILTRMPGVTIVQGKFMQARGLPKRYNKTTLNGTILPTTRPNEKETPLDLFPAGIVDSINVVKTYSPDLPGTFSGGLCQIKTKAIPNDFIMNLKAEANYNTETTFRDYLTYHGGSKDWLGYDDGTRALPGIIPNDRRVARKGSFGGEGFLDLDLEAFGESFDNNWNTYEKNAPLNGSYSFYVGDRFDKFGAILQLNYKNEIHNRSDERYSNYFIDPATGKAQLQTNYDFDRSTYAIKEGGILNMGFDVSPDHKLYVNQYLNRIATDEVIIYDGYSVDVGKDIMVTRLRWIEEQIYNGQLAGEHTIESFLKSNIKWQHSYSDGRLYDPDLRQYWYEKAEGANADEYYFASVPNNPLRMWTEQQEDMYNGTFDWNITLPELSWLIPKLQAGAAYNYRDRDFSSRRFNWEKKDTSGETWQKISTNPDPEYIMQPRYINQHLLVLTESTRPTDNYTARESTAAGYCLLDFSLFQKFQLVIGGRYEKDNIKTTTVDALNPNNSVVSSLADDPWMPSYSLKYAPTDAVNIRFNYSETVDRPEFHELAPYEFTDVIGGGDIVGNPFLQPAEIKNYDVRVEWFINPTDLMALSYFYKDITNAIEPGIQSRPSLTLSYLNASTAFLWGIEFELRKNLGFLSSWLRHYNLSGSYLYSDSETEIEPQPLFVSNTGKRPLAGQPRHLANINLEYDNPDWGFTGRLMYQLTSERLDRVGTTAQPDIYQEQDETFDVVLIKKFGKHYEVKFVAQNLSDEETTYTQGGQIYNTWEDGMTFKLGFSYTW
jgi:outer membrane receptor for ferrienterochelin and colicin